MVLFPPVIGLLSLDFFTSDDKILESTLGLCTTNDAHNYFLWDVAYWDSNPFHLVLGSSKDFRLKSKYLFFEKEWLKHLGLEKLVQSKLGCISTSLAAALWG
jgi:hypothetical protein